MHSDRSEHSAQMSLSCWKCQAGRELDRLPRLISESVLAKWEQSRPRVRRSQSLLPSSPKGAHCFSFALPSLPPLVEPRWLSGRVPHAQGGCRTATCLHPVGLRPSKVCLLRREPGDRRRSDAEGFATILHATSPQHLLNIRPPLHLTIPLQNLHRVDPAQSSSSESARRWNR